MSTGAGFCSHPKESGSLCFQVLRRTVQFLYFERLFFTLDNRISPKHPGLFHFKILDSFDKISLQLEPHLYPKSSYQCQRYPDSMHKVDTKLTIVFISVLRDSPANQIMSEMFDDHFTSDLPKICFVGV